MGASGAVAVLCGKEAKAKKEAGEDVKAWTGQEEEAGHWKDDGTSKRRMVL